jgi:hypothetical protein
MAAEYHGQVTFSGLPLPGSQVTVTATQGTKKESAVTDDQGLFGFTDLTDGTWTITIEMTGFAPVKQDVMVAPNAPVGTFEMKLLTLDEIRAAAKPVKVDVNAPVVAAAPAAPAATPAAGAATAAKGAAATPGLKTRTPAAPAKGAAAGTQAASAAAPDAPAPAPDAATASQTSDGLLINGSVNNAATSQFSMSQAFGNTRNGRSMYNAGLALNITNSSLNARQYSITGIPVPNAAFTNFVGSINFGGPLKIPKLLPATRAPNFFVGYTRTQQDNNTARQAVMPTMAERGGTLLGLTTNPIYVPTNIAAVNPNCYTFLTTPSPGWVPLSPAQISAGTAQFLGNVIPSTCIASQATQLLSYYPQPTLAATTGNNYQAATTNSTRADSYNLRMYRQIGSKNNLNGGFNVGNSRSGANSLFGFHDATRSLGMNANLSWYHRFTQRLSGNVNYNWSRNRQQQAPFFANSVNVEGQDNILGVDTAPTYWGPPGLSFQSVYGLSDGVSAYNRNETNSVGLEVDWNKFRHNVAVGGDFRRQEFNVLTQSNPRGSFQFNGTATNGGQVGAGSDFADFLLGIPDTSSISYGNADKYLRQSVYDLYARDDFRVNPEFSINYGVRWEYGAPITELKGRLVNLDIAPGFTAEAPVVASSPTGPLTGTHYPSSLVNPDKIGVAPNVGIAWRPISGSSLLIRAGYQIGHDTSVYTQAAMAMATQHGTTAVPLSTSLSLSNSSTCPLTMTNGFNGCALITPDQFALDPNFRVGYIQIWNFIVQRDLPGSLQMIATYLGNKGTKMTQEYLPNSYAYGGTPTCATCPVGFAYKTSGGDSTRESGQIQLRRRLRSGFTANISYIYSKSLDDAYSFGGSQGVGVNAQVAQNWQDLKAQRGLSTFDQRNVLAVTAQYTTGMGLGGHTLLDGWKGLIYKEWTVLATFNTGSGLPETPTDSYAIGGTAYSGIMRANMTGAGIHAGTGGLLYINPNAFTLPAAGQFGNARRDSIPGPDQFSLNASMNRAFRLKDRFNLTAEIDANNVLNHVVYSSWYTNVLQGQGTGAASTTTTNLFGTPTGANQMRTVAFQLRLRWN